MFKVVCISANGHVINTSENVDFHGLVEVVFTSITGIKAGLMRSKKLKMYADKDKYFIHNFSAVTDSDSDVTLDLPVVTSDGKEHLLPLKLSINQIITLGLDLGLDVCMGFTVTRISDENKSNI